MFWDLLCDICYTCSFKSHWVLFLLSPTLFGSLILSPPLLGPFQGHTKLEDVLIWPSDVRKACDGFVLSRHLESAPQSFLFHAEDIFTRLVSEWASLVARHWCSLLWSSSCQRFQDHLFLPRTQRWLWRQESAVVGRTFLVTQQSLPVLLLP